MLRTFRHALLLLGLTICIFFAAELIFVGQLLSGLERAGLLAYSLTLCAFCAAGFKVFFARWSGVGGEGLAMALSKVFTSSPIQFHKFRGILRVNRAPALVHQQQAVL
jgi:hypothetical protein